MKPQNLEHILSLLKEMEKCELTIARLYQTCADMWEEDKEFWLSLERQEQKHAKNINKMVELISEKDEQFECYRPFNPIAMKTIISGIEDNINSIKDGKFSREKALFIALDIEKSLIESKYGEIVKSENVEYQNLVGGIINETEGHKKLIQNKITKIKNEE